MSMSQYLFIAISQYREQKCLVCIAPKVGLGGVRMLEVTLRYLIYFARVVQKLGSVLEKLFYETEINCT